jgi:hypothetical protein
MAAALLAGALSGVLLGPLVASAHAESGWTTYHHDAARSGVDPEAGSPVTPTLAWQSADLGAPIWSQPLILGSRAYVATLGDEVYALDARTGKVIWSKSVGTPVPVDESRCQPEVGIVGTPVIDTATKTLFAVADTWDPTAKEAHHVLVGLNLDTGERVLDTPADPPGANPGTLLQRPALNLDAGRVLFGFGGNPGDCGVYRGAVGAAAESGGPVSFWQYSPASPAYGGGAVWGTSGPAVDAEGHIYVSTGNPNFPKGEKVSSYDYSDSVVKLDASMSLVGNFEPATWLSDSNNDLDLGSAGPEPLPGGLLFQAGKNEMGYLIDESTMGTAAAAVYSAKVCNGAKAGEGSFGGDSFSAGTIYVPCADGVRALAYNQAARTFAALWHGPADATGPPIVSNGLVWVVSGKFLQGGGTTLYALDPTTGSTRYAETLPSPVADHFASPSAAGGRVFVATGSSVTAYQVAELDPPTVTTGPGSSITQSTATLTASVNPNGWNVDACEFQYGTTSAYGHSAPCAPSPGSGTGGVPVSAPIAGLAANATYHFRIIASNSAGTSPGADEALTTMPNSPSVLTEPASAVGSSSATLNATIDASGADIEDCHFDYGTTPSFGSHASCTPTPAVNPRPATVSAQLEGLAAGMTYYFRAAATNTGGTGDGAVLTLTTVPANEEPKTSTQKDSGEHGLLGFKEQLAPPAPSARLAGTLLTASTSGTLTAVITCSSGTTQCVGVVTIRTASAVFVRGRTKLLTLASGRFNVAAGGRAVIKMHLSAAARKLLARRRAFRARAIVSTRVPVGPDHITQTFVTIRTSRVRRGPR